MNKVKVFFIVIFTQLCTLIVLSYILNRLYFYGDILDSRRMKGIFPKPKRFNKLATNIASTNSFGSSMTISRTNGLSSKLMGEAKVLIGNGKREMKIDREMPLPDSYSKNIEITTGRPKISEHPPPKRKHLYDGKHVKVTLSGNNDSLSPLLTKTEIRTKSRPKLLFSDFIEKQKVLKNVDLVIMVLTAPPKFQRRRNIRKTWWKDCRGKNKVGCWFFTDPFNSITNEKVRSEIQIEQDKHKDIIFTPVNPGMNFGFRFLYLIQWAKANYNFNYALRIDDDVMLCVDHLMWDLPHFPSQDVHYGWLHCQREGIVYVDDGIVMFSKDIIAKFLAQDADEILCHPYGDQQISIWEQEIGLNQTELIRADNERIHNSPPASFDKSLKKRSNLCHYYIAIHGLYKDDLLEFWNRRGNGNGSEYSRYTETEVGGFCPFKPYLDWTVMGGMYRQEPKPCHPKPFWDINAAFEMYPGRESWHTAETK